MLKIGSITKAIEMCNKARELGWSVIIGHDDGITETQDSFLADLAVGLGAGQLAAGGVASGEYISKYNRLLEILRSDEMLSFSGSKFRR
jgi:enolase